MELRNLLDDELESGFLMSSGDTIIVNSDSRLAGSWIMSKDRNIKLPFVFASVYRGRAWELNLPKVGSFLALESYTPGASGLGANVVNVTLIQLDRNPEGSILKFNSFFGGIESLVLDDEGDVLLEIVDISTIGNQELYCKSLFKLNEQGVFSPHNDSQSCFTFQKGQWSTSEGCQCEKLLTPLVWNNEARP